MVRETGKDPFLLSFGHSVPPSSVDFYAIFHLPGTAHPFSTRSLLIIVLFQLLTLQVIEGVNPGNENMTIFQHTTNQKRKRSQSHLQISAER